MMLSSWLMNGTRPSAVGYHSAAWITKNNVIAMPIAMRTMCCFKRPPAGRLRRRLKWPRRKGVLRGTPPSSLQEEFHLHAGEFDDVVILERSRRRSDLLPVHRGPGRALNVGDEVALRPAGEHRVLHARLAEGGERLVELELLAGVAAGEQLDRPERLCRLRRRRSR